MVINLMQFMDFFCSYIWSTRSREF